MDGFLFLDKPQGYSSSSCVYKLRRILKQKRIGHCGTLDPLATGILPICIGEATKFSKFISEQPKEYVVKIVLGLQTDTGDIEGKELFFKKPRISRKRLVEILRGLHGEYTQIPPMFSAKKRMGKPLFYWARKGIFLRRDATKVYINSIQLLTLEDNLMDIKVSCSKGTYIRALTETIGEKLGTRACVLALRRTKIGSITTRNLLGLSSNEMRDYRKAIIPSESALKDIPKVFLKQKDGKKIRNGQLVDYNAPEEIEGIVRLYEEEGSFIGIGTVDSMKKVSPKRLLNDSRNYIRN